MNQQTLLTAIIFAGATGHTGEDRAAWAVTEAAKLADLCKDNESDTEQRASAELTMLQTTHAKTLENLAKAIEEGNKVKAQNKKLKEELETAGTELKAALDQLKAKQA